MARLTWKKDRSRGFGFDPWPSFQLNFGTLRDLANVSAATNGPRYRLDGWMWSCGTNADLGIVHHNTAGQLVSTPEEAKSQAECYIRSCLEAKGLLKPRKEVVGGEDGSRRPGE